ncbi:MAG: VTT domain-containing protein [Streptococcus hyovaginalis]|nr:VTT domain-containing protein [Streptococcus hyovaginalis]
MNRSKRGIRSFVKVLSLVVLGASLILVYVLFANLHIAEDPQALQRLIAGDRFWGALLFFGMQVMQVLIAPIPGGIMTVVGMMAFGPVLGFALDYIGILLGSWCLFRLVRRFGRSLIYLFLSEEKLAKYERHFFGKSFQSLFILIMLTPMGPADITVMLAGLSKLSNKRVLLILVLCRPVSIISYSWFWLYGSQWLEVILPFQ